jgi:hypothetical protein
MAGMMRRPVGEADAVIADSSTQLAVTPRDRYLQAAQREMTEFERREREFLRKERQERAAELQLPVQEIELKARRRSR